MGNDYKWQASKKCPMLKCFKNTVLKMCHVLCLVDWVSDGMKWILFCVLQKIAYCITPEHEHHKVAEGNVRQFKVSATF